MPYYLCGLFFMLPVKRMTGYYNKENFIEAVTKFLIGKGDGHLWFLPALFWCFIIFWCIHRLAGKKNIYPVLRGMGYLFWFALGYWFDGMRHKLSEYSSYKYGICKFFFV